jgi:hypothetical protein
MNEKRTVLQLQLDANHRALRRLSRLRQLTPDPKATSADGSTASAASRRRVATSRRRILNETIEA